MVLYITMNGNSRTCRGSNTFALMYRRANGTFYEFINVKCSMPCSYHSLFAVQTKKDGSWAAVSWNQATADSLAHPLPVF